MFTLKTIVTIELDEAHFTKTGQRFWSQVQVVETGCWIWTGGVDGDYGRFNFDGGCMKANRYSWAFVNGPIPEGMLVCHTCDMPLCVNPKHLFLGTYLDNNRDRARKGRTAMGERHGSKTHPERLPRGAQHHWNRRPECREKTQGQNAYNASMTNEQARQAKIWLSEGVGPTEIARRLGTSKDVILHIKRGRTWKHVTV